MTENTAGLTHHSRWPRIRAGRWLYAVMVTVLAGIVLVCAAVMESRFDGLTVNNTIIAETPVTLYRPTGAGPLPPVIMAHGFAGSRQMMDQIAVSLARQGFVVASLDLPGHGRNPARMSADITNLDGTTAQLVASVAAVADAIAARPDTAGPVSFVGHSMATDVVIRVAQGRDDVGGVVAISMYSPAITATSPAQLLVLSGATEGHLREAGLAAARLVSAAATEGETVTTGAITRRTAVAPYVGHVGVLYAPTSLDETTRWIRNATGAGAQAALDTTGWVAGLLLAALVALFWPLSRLLPASVTPIKPISKRTSLICLLAPFPAALAITLLPVFGIAGYAAFGSLGAFLAAWGMIQLAVLYFAGHRLQRPDAVGLAVYLALGLVFAAALDRYGAAFLPTGDRLLIALALTLGTLPLMLADSMLSHKAPILRRILVRLALLLALGTAMALSPTTLGLTFTTLPVLLLFFLVYGNLARWIANRRGPAATAIGQGLAFAYAIVASAPLFAA